MTHFILTIITAALMGCTTPEDSLALATPVEVDHYQEMMDFIGPDLQMGRTLEHTLRSSSYQKSSRHLTKYSIRIFFNNSRDARTRSEEIMNQFKELYPDVPVVRSYVNPYFKVSVGSFRTKSEALRFMEKIQNLYPSVYLVKENF
ncbi:MAG: SPOR domain-containing protein [Bacteroidales bacterium]|nr:SPOR domain-containing protein [Bacteroidales bacterium]